MGRKSRTKHQASTLAAKKKRVTPDDYFQHGPLEMARFGKYVMMRNNMSKEQRAQFMKDNAARLPAVIREIDGHVAAIVRIVKQYDPLSLLQRGYWVSILPYIMPSDDSEKKADVVGQRMVDYVQSVIAAVPTKHTPAPPVSEEAWGELSRHVEELFDAINHHYLHCRTANWTVNGGGPPDEQMEFYVRAMAMWCNVTGHRYHFQEIDYLRALIAPHSEVFVRIWGIDAEEMLRGFSGILHALTRGLGEAMERMWDVDQAYLRAKENAAGNETALEQQLESLRREEGVQDSLNRLFGVGLFQIDQHLPRSLLDDLAWVPGECSDFIDQGPQSGWPTRIWPRTRRPFLKIGGSYYCFDIHTLFDNIYRVLERTVRAKEPAYAQKWNERQKQVSETLPFALLAKLLPGAKSWRSVFYEIDEVDMHGRKKWCELDGLLASEDHLFIVEVKGGTFTAASPEAGFDSHLKSIERLIFAPVDQGERFLRWLNQRGKVDLCDDQHCKIGELSRAAFAHVTVCAVSLDPFTELSAKAYHMRHLVGRPKAVPFWALSIGDLLTYTDLFDNPLVFLHFVEKRNQATASNKVTLDDEFDHYGMYLQHNSYELHAEKVAGGSRTQWTGYRTIIDKYFDARTRGQPATLPRQEMPALYWSIIQILTASRHVHRRHVASLLLDGDGDMRKNTERNLLNSLDLQVKFLRPRPVVIGGKEMRISFVCWQTGVMYSANFDAAEYCQASMLAAREPDRWLIELYFDADRRLWQVEPRFFKAENLSDTQRKRLEAMVDQLRNQRIDQSFTERGKVGRNQLCPCGSGKKYKHCCGA